MPITKISVYWAVGTTGYIRVIYVSRGQLFEALDGSRVSVNDPLLGLILTVTSFCAHLCI